MILFNLLAKGIILLGFLVAAPYLLKQYALNYTDDRLAEKRIQVLDIINQEGISSFFSEDEESGYGSYNLLKEEYISLEIVSDSVSMDTIFNEERIIEDEIVSYRVLAHTFSEHNTSYLLEIGRSLETIEQIERVLSTFIFVVFIAFILVSVFFDGVFHAFLLRPFYKIIYEKLPGIKEPHQYAFQPIETKTQDFKILDDAISDMMKRIQHAFNREREFIAHASHELRTPISILQFKIENMLSDSRLEEPDMLRVLDMQRTIQRFKHMVNSLLLISKISNDQYVKNEEVDLQAIINELGEEWVPIAQEKNLELNVMKGSAVLIRNSNHSMVMMMIQNVLTNAIRYSPSSGVIRMRIITHEESIVVEVSDTGTGIPISILEQVRAGTVFLKDAKSEKSGFGLQITQKIATYLNIQFVIDSSPAGTIIQFIF